MRLVTAIIRPEKLAAVKEALFEAGVTGMTLSRVSGHGGEREVIEQYRGARFMVEFHEKVQLTIGVSEAFVDTAIGAIVKAAPHGRSRRREDFRPAPRARGPHPHGRRGRVGGHAGEGERKR